MLPGRVRDLQAGKVRRLLAQPLDDGDRDRVAAARLELVEVERHRGAGRGGRNEVREQLLLVEREVRRRDDRHRVGACLGRTGCERDGVVRRLRADVHGHLEPARSGFDERLGDLRPSRGREHDALAGRAEDEHAVEPVPGEEVEIRRDRGGVEGAVPERRHGGGDGSLQHGGHSKSF